MGGRQRTKIFYMLVKYWHLVKAGFLKSLILHGSLPKIKILSTKKPPFDHSISFTLQLSSEWPWPFSFIHPSALFTLQFNSEWPWVYRKVRVTSNETERSLLGQLEVTLSLPKGQGHLERNREMSLPKGQGHLERNREMSLPKGQSDLKWDWKVRVASS